MEAPPRSYIGGIPNNMAVPPVNEPNAIAPIVEGPGIRDLPPDGRQSYSVIAGAAPILAAPRRTWRQGCLLYNEDSTNAIRYGEDATIGTTAANPTGALLPALGAVILRGSPPIYIVAVAGTPRVTVCDEWFAAPPQRQPMGL